MGYSHAHHGVPAAGGGTAYVTGDRTASITVTSSPTLLSGTNSILVNGSTIGTGLFFASIQAVAGLFIKFDFGTSKIVDEAKWYQQSAGTTHGVWQWAGSNDDSSYATIGATFTLGAGVDPSIQTTLNGNTTAYRYYRLTGVSGNCNDNPYLFEIEFKQN